MFNKLKPHLLPLAIYFAMGQVLYSVGIDVTDWQWWAVYLLLMTLHIGISNAEFDRHFHEQMERCEQCVYQKNWHDAMFADFRKQVGLTPPSSAQSVPEDTSPHAPKPPQS